MRAVVHDVYGAPEVLRLEEVEAPLPARTRSSSGSRPRSTGPTAGSGVPIPSSTVFSGLRRPKRAHLKDRAGRRGGSGRLGSDGLRGRRPCLRGRRGTASVRTPSLICVRRGRPCAASMSEQASTSRRPPRCATGWRSPAPVCAAAGEADRRPADPASDGARRVDRDGRRPARQGTRRREVTAVCSEDQRRGGAIPRPGRGHQPRRSRLHRQRPDLRRDLRCRREAVVQCMPRVARGPRRLRVDRLRTPGADPVLALTTWVTSRVARTRRVLLPTGRSG